MDPGLKGRKGKRKMNSELMENDPFVKELEESFRGKVLLSIEDIAQQFGCDVKTVINWTKRLDTSRRPPRVILGNEIRFPKKSFIHWFLVDQGLIKG